MSVFPIEENEVTMKTILYAHSGSGNHGCEALVRSTAQIIKERPVLLTSGLEEDYKYHVDEVVDIYPDYSRRVNRHSLKYFIAAIQTKLTHKTTRFTEYIRSDLLSKVEPGDICLSVGGDNYCYAGVEELSNLNILLHNRRAKTVLWGCSIDEEALTPEVIADLKRYDMITVREPLTQAALAQAGVSENVRKVADSAFLLEPQPVQLPKGFVPGNTIGINFSPLIFKYTERKEDAMTSFYELVEYILKATDSTVALIPHVVKENNNDLDVLKPVYDRFKDTGRVLLIQDQNCMQLKYIISQCRLFIGARTHATIAAYSTYVPTLVVGYSIKSRGIAEDLFGTEKNYVLPVQNIYNGSDLVNAYSWLEDHSEEIKVHLQKVIPQYRKQALLAREFFEEISSK